jgi:hypothetical protein
MIDRQEHHARLNLPGLHAWHTDDAVTLLNRPGEHEAQKIAPAPDEKPTSQSAHTVLPPSS